MLDGTTHVHLLWEPDEKKVGIRPAAPDDPSAFRVTRAPSQALITSKGFVDEHKLPYSVRMPLEWDGSMWIASTQNLAEPPS